MSASVEVGGRKFTYRRPTITLIRKLAKRDYEKSLASLGDPFLSNKELRKIRKVWKAFCGDVFERTGLWKIGIFPRALKLDNLPYESVPEVTQGFFGLLKETHEKVTKLSGGSGDSKTASGQG